MRTYLVRLFSACTVLLTVISVNAESAVNIDKSGVILQGYDAISYFKSSEPQLGSSKISTAYGGATYLFASEANKQEFLKDPKKYAPQFGGWCAYAVADSKAKVEVDPKSFVIQDGRLLLFYNGIFASTRSKWQKDPKTFLKAADANWPEVEKKDP
jgi:YHS domain-containing protein